jgi:hypothetical protein
MDKFDYETYFHYYYDGVEFVFIVALNLDGNEINIEKHYPESYGYLNGFSDFYAEMTKKLNENNINNDFLSNGLLN